MCPLPGFKKWAETQPNGVTSGARSATSVASTEAAAAFRCRRAPASRKYDSTNRELLTIPSVSRTLELAVPVAIGCLRGPLGKEPDRYVAETADNEPTWAQAARPSTRGISPGRPSAPSSPVGAHPIHGRRRHDVVPQLTRGRRAYPRRRASTAASSAASPGHAAGLQAPACRAVGRSSSVPHPVSHHFTWRMRPCACSRLTAQSRSGVAIVGCGTGGGGGGGCAQWMFDGA